MLSFAFHLLDIFFSSFVSNWMIYFLLCFMLIVAGNVAIVITQLTHNWVESNYLSVWLCVRTILFTLHQLSQRWFDLIENNERKGLRALHDAELPHVRSPTMKRYSHWENLFHMFLNGLYVDEMCYHVWWLCYFCSWKILRYLISLVKREKSFYFSISPIESPAIKKCSLFKNGFKSVFLLYALVASYFMLSNDDLHNKFAQFGAINCIRILHENLLRHCGDIKHEGSSLLYRRFSIFNEK